MALSSAGRPVSVPESQPGVLGFCYFALKRCVTVKAEVKKSRMLGDQEESQEQHETPETSNQRQTDRRRSPSSAYD